MLEQQTWVTVSAVAGGWLALMGYLRNMKQDLKAEIVDLRTELKAEIVGVRTEAKTDNARLETQLVNTHADLKTDIGRVDGRLVALESRVYDIATRLPAATAPSPPTGS